MQKQCDTQLQIHMHADIHTSTRATVLPALCKKGKNRLAFVGSCHRKEYISLVERTGYLVVYISKSQILRLHKQENVCGRTDRQWTDTNRIDIIDVGLIHQLL